MERALNIYDVLLIAVLGGTFVAITWLSWRDNKE